MGDRKNEFGQRHGNAASTGAYDQARDFVRGAVQGDRSLPPLGGPSGRGTTDLDWAPRLRTAEELRARFQDGSQKGTHAARGDSVDRGGRRLTDFDLDEQEERLRMPEPMPISWLSPVTPQPRTAVLRHLGGGSLGLLLGLTLLVPAVLWQKGRIDPARSVTEIAATFGFAAASPPTVPEMIRREAAAAAPRTVRVPVEVVPPSEPPPAAAIAASVAVIKPVPVEVAAAAQEAARAETLLGDARRLIVEGDLRTARSVLEDQAVSSLPMARFLLAETYDPNFLAASGVRSVRAEVPRAVELYRLALDGGIDAARQRINALRP